MSILYFGPYNDPGDTHTPTPLHHWEAGHDPDCHNAAFTVDRSLQVLTITLAVRNRDVNPSPSDLVVTLYAAACGLFGTLPDVSSLISRILANGLPDPSSNPDGVSTYVNEWSTRNGNAPFVPAFSSTTDTPWLSNQESWTVPAFSSSVILVATLSTATGSQSPSGPYTQDPCVGIWLG
jgi:hypothetical protein